jgi:hypothetical protein
MNKLAQEAVVGQFELEDFAERWSVAGFDMPKSKRKSKKQQNREKRDFAETASAVFQQAMGIKQPRARHPAQRHSRSGRSR